MSFSDRPDHGLAVVGRAASVSMPAQVLSALAGIEIEEHMEGRGDAAVRVKRVKIKASDKQTAIMNLARLRSLLPADRLEHSGAITHTVRPEHKIDIEAMDHDEREQLRTLLLKASGNVTDVEDES